ncbi:TPM domain-containing protein [Zhouia amylolytica]|uniref:TPM domain-containing protein n=1 Tax=Zhouia amylolytica TaxID=376730 RepID=UPI0020CC42ED|nr:TPM domain-containing protein [Zhouia amylolytica]MCQ0112487.1 TPM domain-containing protein [Zhouia amylolytica]
MSEVEEFLTPEEEKEIVAAIRTAEMQTSGEIRVHIEKSSQEKEAFERAKEVFHWLKMDQTKEANGVLIYVAVHDHTFAICGDKGINEKVPKGFWDSTKDVMQKYFRHKQFKQGLVEGILKAGTELRMHFPWKHDDADELSNEISKA